MEITSILMYATSNEITQLIAKDNRLFSGTVAKPVPEQRLKYLRRVIPAVEWVEVSLSDISNKLCDYQVSDLSHVKTDFDNFKYVENVMFCHNKSYGDPVYDAVSKTYKTKINLGSRATPEIDEVSVNIDPKYAISGAQGIMHIEKFNPHIEVLEYRGRCI